MAHIEQFAVEQWMNENENDCRFNLAETCVRALTLAELLDLAGGVDLGDRLLATQLTYGPITGSPELRARVAELYRAHGAEDVLIAHGAIGANELVHTSLVGAGDHVVTVVPTYQQHYSIPERLGARVTRVQLREEEGWRLDLAELERAVSPGTRLIALSNPNNPTGALLSRDELEAIADIARRAGAWVLCDEVYRGLDQAGDGFSASIADLYDRGVSTGSMSKPYSLAGLRLGWIVGPSELLAAAMVHRDYNTISVGRIDDALAALALGARDAVLARAHRITRTNLEVLDAWVAGQPHVSYVKPASGTTALLRYDAPADSDTVARGLLAETGVLYTPGDAFGIPRTLRIGFADDRETLERGLDLTADYLAGLSA